jgi:ankyrin repeat protein
MTILCILEHQFGGFRSYHNTRKLLEAIKTEDVNKVKELLDEGIDPNETDVAPSKFWVFLETSPNRPLTIACDTGNLEIVELLIEYGATAEPIEGTGRSPLRQVLFYFQPDDVEIVKLLFENGASVEDGYSEDMVCFAALMEPRAFDKTKANGTVFEEGYDEMTAKGITEIIDILIMNGGSLDGTIRADKTVLIISVERENIYLTEYLLRAGCDTSIKDKHGKMALDYALESGNEELILMLNQGQ